MVDAIHINNPNEDLSDLYFIPKDLPKKPQVVFSNESPSEDCDYFIGPILVTTTGVSHGLGVVASRDIQAGECLFVTRPAVSADMTLVFQEWKSKQQNGSNTTETIPQQQTLLEQAAEEVLVKTMRQKLNSETESDKVIAQSFLLQLSKGDESTARHMEVPKDPTSLVDKLVGKSNGDMTSTSPISELDIDNDKLLEVIRRNSFGPEFTSYESVETQWKIFLESGSTSTHPPNPSRLLGLYPLAAMLNHSCIPNALRVFVSGDWMVVHASSSIRKGDEIVWSYLPPLLPYPRRRKQLEERHGFVCRCVRCEKEEEAASCSEIYVYPESLKPFQNSGNIASLALSAESRHQFTVDLLEWEQRNFADDSRHSNETRRYWKMGNANFYIQYLNAVLMDLPNQAPDDVDKVRTNLVMKAMELHFCFLSCNQFCTEHLSVMHLCYELVAILHSRATDPTKTISKVQFWTEQLKRAHLIRYGSLGQNLDKVRAIMKHTQMVLRNTNGLEKAPYDFI